MRKVTEKGRVGVTRSKEHNKCYSCADRVTAKTSNVYELNGRKFVVLCDYCVAAIEQLGTEDEDIFGLVGGIRMKHFLKEVEKVDGKHRQQSRRTSK